MNDMRVHFNNLPFETYIEEQKKYGLDQQYFLRMNKKGFAPLNFDSDTKVQARKIAKKLLRKYSKSPYLILFRKSSSRRGFHFVVFKDSKQLFLKKKEILKIRKKYHDCLGRQFADIERAKRGLAISVLFHHKWSKNCTDFISLEKLSDLK
jgi:hypothetical protein